MNAGGRGRRRLPAIASGLMVASGFASLGYQIVWTQQTALWIGHESAAVLAVVTAFFGGLAIGAWRLGPAIERSARPAWWYAGCELAIGLWSLLLVWWMAPCSAALVRWTGPTPTPVVQWTTAFVGTFVLLLPATAAMGATLPAVERIVCFARGTGRSIAGLYAANTAGATFGVLGTALLVPAIGLARTAGLCAGLNLLCAAAALAWRRDERTATTSAPIDVRPARGVLALSAATGLIGIGYEVLVVRVLSEIAEDTVYTFALVLAVYLTGSAVGAAAFARWTARRHRNGPDDATLTDRLLLGLATCSVASIAALWFCDTVHRSIVDRFGPGVGASLAAETTVALVAFALPTMTMGALFSQLGARASAAGVGFGRAIGWNVAGATAAPLLFGVGLLPLLGAKIALLLVPTGYLLATGARGWRRPAAMLPAVAILVVAAWTPPLAFVDVPDGGRLVRYREGAMAAVSVVADADGTMRLRIDNRAQEGSSATRLVDGRQALLPVLLHPAPHRALFLGLGTGITASTAAAMPGLEVDAVELLPEVIDASRSFVVGPAPGLHVIRADARRFVRSTTKHYDVVVADNFHPARAGSGSLYTVEHFAAVRDVLAPDGLFCQWLPLHQLDLETLRSIVRSFVAVYPEGRAMLASNSLGTPVLGLVGGRDDRRFDFEAVAARVAAAARDEPVAGSGIDDAFALLGSFVAGPAALAHFAEGAPINTDDRPVVAYRAPRATYAPESLPQDRLLALLRAVSIRPDELLAPGTDAVIASRLAAYWTARDRFVDAGRVVRPSDDVRAMLAQVRDPLLDVLRTSPDFRPAYDPLLRMAVALAVTDVEAARPLLQALATIQPARAEAAMALRALDGR